MNKGLIPASFVHESLHFEAEGTETKHTLHTGSDVMNCYYTGLAVEISPPSSFSPVSTPPATSGKRENKPASEPVKSVSHPVSFSTCFGLAGHIHTGDEIYYIEPVTTSTSMDGKDSKAGRNRDEDTVNESGVVDINIDIDVDPAEKGGRVGHVNGGDLLSSSRRRMSSQRHDERQRLHTHRSFRHSDIYYDDTSDHRHGSEPHHGMGNEYENKNKNENENEIENKDSNKDAHTSKWKGNGNGNGNGEGNGKGNGNGAIKAVGRHAANTRMWPGSTSASSGVRVSTGATVGLMDTDVDITAVFSNPLLTTATTPRKHKQGARQRYGQSAAQEATFDVTSCVLSQVRCDT